MNVFAKFDEIPSMILEVIKETKRYGHTDGRSYNVKTVYPPTNTVCGGVYLPQTQFAGGIISQFNCPSSPSHKNLPNLPMDEDEDYWQ